MFSYSNLIIFFALLALNLVFTWRSNRKKRFGLFPFSILLVFFVAYWGYVFYLFKYSNYKTSAQVVSVSGIKKGAGEKEATAAYQERSHKALQHKIQLERELNKHIENIVVLLRILLIQSILSLLFSIYGLIDVVGRAQYYTTLIVLNLIITAFCLFADLTDSVSTVFN